jgi:hypothetical protein
MSRNSGYTADANIIREKLEKGTSTGKGLNWDSLKNLIEKKRDEQITPLLALSNSQESKILTNKYNYYKHNKTARNCVFFEILLPIAEEFDGWGAPLSENPSREQVSSFIWNRIYRIKNTPEKMDVFLAWLWRDHEEDAKELYKNCGLSPRPFIHSDNNENVGDENDQSDTNPMEIDLETKKALSKIRNGIRELCDGVYQWMSINVNDPKQIAALHRELSVAFGRNGFGDFQDERADRSKGNRNRTDLYEVFEFRKFIADNAMIETFQKKPVSYYRQSSWRTITDAMLDDSKLQLIDRPCISVENMKGYDLFSVGGARSSPSVRISLGCNADGTLSKDYGELYYHMDVSSNQNIIQDNFGGGVTSEPRNFIASKKGECYYPKTIEINNGLHLVTQDMALLTIVANPFDHTKRHVLISACHGMGCVALSGLINDREFQKESKFIDFVDSSNHILDYYQALISIDVFWDKDKFRYDINKDKGRYYKIINVIDSYGLPKIRTEKEASLIYQEIIDERLNSIPELEISSN